ncbi:RNP domain-containing protein [Aspergillus sclerotialis]|uniref:RNP domain-containing protein n=1 Tax=Aspergillus sclerotialis TaxID=2070753 RepID=A0A3A2ZW55_9EURO|nr:RNP domain-containing protein [Aspergillus sclerotialis]
MPSASFAYPAQRERSRSPRRRSRSPRRSRRSYSRSRSRSREDYRRSDRRSRSPMSGVAGAPGGYPGSGYGGRSYGPPPRSFEDRAVAKEQMMQSVRESSQQDRRVYVGNLSYDVKWHHLKDFMRQGEQGHVVPVA